MECASASPRSYIARPMRTLLLKRRSASGLRPSALAARPGIPRRRVGALVLPLLLGACASPAVRPPAPRVVTPLGADSAATREVAPGVVHRRLVVNGGPFVVHVVELDLRRRDLEVRAEHAFGRLDGRETTSALARRIEGDSLDVLVAVNADFFTLRTGEVIGNQVIEGRLVTGVGRAADARRPPRSHFALTRDGRPLIERFVMQGRVIVGRDTLALAGVNTPPVRDAIVLRTWPAPDTLPADSAGDVRALRLNALSAWPDSAAWVAEPTLLRAGQARMPRRGALLVARGAAAASLEQALVRARGDARVGVLASWRLTPERPALRTLLGGWPRLVVDGVSVGDSTAWHEGAVRSFITQRHPRTGVGFSRDSTTLYLVVVDGRQRHSAGMSIPEFAETMRALGAWQAVNFDGGGSTTIVVNDSIVNSPSDPTGERPIGNALLVVRGR